METILSISAIVIATWSAVLSYMCHKDLRNTEHGLRKCATISRANTLDITTLANKVNKPKAKRGRPRKNAPAPKIIHQLYGGQ
jgi:hypothetical protein